MYQDKDKTLPLGKLCLSRGDNLSGQPALRQGGGADAQGRVKPVWRKKGKERGGGGGAFLMPVPTRKCTHINIDVLVVTSA